MSDHIHSVGPLKRFYRELRRRHVFESAGLYVAGAWMLVEVSDTLFPTFGVPDFALRILVIAMFALFPVVLILAWMFDVTISGLVRTNDVPTLPKEFDFGAVPKRSIAVLPFVNMTGDPQNEYFGDGLAEELLNLLAKTEGLKVAARTSSFAFKGKETDIRDIGGLLGVRNVLEGSVRQAGKRLRITAQLIEAPTGYHLWSDTFDRAVDDIFAIQDEISGSISEALQIALAGKGRKQRSGEELPTDNIEAYQYFLRATYLWQRRGADALRGAITALEQAIGLDPNFAEAYARLAAAGAILHEFTDEHREEHFAVAEARARKAIALDPMLAEPHGVLGYMAIRLWHWQEAEQHLTRAIELDKNLPINHQWFSNLLNDLGRHDDARREASAAHAMDPLSPTANNLLAFSALFQDDNATAIKHAAIAREYGLGGGIPDYIDLIVGLRKGADVHDKWAKFLERSGLQPVWLQPVLDGIVDPAQRDTALQALDDARANEHINLRHLFFHYVLLNEPRAFDIAESMLADHGLAHTWLMLPEGAKLREHPRFYGLMDAIGVMDYWRHNGFPPHIEPLAA